MLIEVEEVLEALEKERQYLLGRGQYAAEHILVHHAIDVIEELIEQANIFDGRKIYDDDSVET